MDTSTRENIVLDGKGIERALTRIGHEILEKNHDLKKLAIVGIRTRGAILGERIAANIKAIEGVAIPLGALDVTFYRDDLNLREEQPRVKNTDIHFDLTGKSIILVDDVLCSGRTVRAALDALIDFGRPEKIQLAVLVDRGHRELPIRADYVGKNIPTGPADKVRVRIAEHDDAEEVAVLESVSE
jgi:pyrimidine operon attenuation protein / uracil phosphoribosyltransferase